MCSGGTDNNDKDFTHALAVGLPLCTHAGVLRHRRRAPRGAPAHADQLSRLYQEILRSPENVELNLRYADLALQQGHRRKALAAYERVLDVDPGNQAARSGLRSINVGLTPAVTRGRVELGARWESNVRELPKTTNRPDDLVGFAKLFVTDERPLFNNVWQSDLWAYADIHDDVSSLDYWIARAHTGPLFNLGGNTTLHVAPGGSVAFLDADYFYSEAALKLTFEQLFGVLDKFEVRGGYRDVGGQFTPSHGVAIDVVAREAIRGVITDSDVFVVQPFFRWRDANNITNIFGLPTSFLMGDYIEAGGTLMYFMFVERTSVSAAGSPRITATTNRTRRRSSTPRSATTT